MFQNRLSHIEDLLKWFFENPDYQIYSFDIFDTILRRRIDPPELIKRFSAEHIAALLANQGELISPSNILFSRSKIESFLQNKSILEGKDPQCHLDEVIIETLKTIGVKSLISADDIIQYELDLEKKASEKMPHITDVLKFLRSHGRRIICISETYLSCRQVAKLLEYNDLLKYFDSIYVSSDIGLGKSTGNLFRYVINKEGNKIIHIGDRYDQDVQMPNKLGIKALWFHDINEQKRKQKLIKSLKNKDRMNYVNTIITFGDKKDDNLLFHLGYQVFGPALTVFMHNVIEDARKDGIEIMNFIARDGYILKKIYEIFCDSVYKNQSIPPSKYLCISRFSVKLASLGQFNMRELDAILSKAYDKYLALGDIFQAYTMEPSDWEEVLKLNGLKVDDPINDQQNRKKILALFTNKDFQNKINAERQEAKTMLREYLSENGFVNGKRIAVIDIQASGFTQSLLPSCFDDDKDYPVVNGFYFNLRKGRSSLDLPQLHGIVSDWRKSSENEAATFEAFGCLLEAVTHPNHGITIGYNKLRNGRILPAFRRTPMEEQYRIRSSIIRGIISYSTDYTNLYCLHNFDPKELLKYEKIKINKWVSAPPKNNVYEVRWI